jgi:hypothetical protein
MDILKLISVPTNCPTAYQWPAILECASLLAPSRAKLASRDQSGSMLPHSKFHIMVYRYRSRCYSPLVLNDFNHLPGDFFRVFLLNQLGENFLQ